MNSLPTLHLSRALQNDRYETTAQRRRARHPGRSPDGCVAALFAAMFAAQAGLLSLGPVLADVAREFGVSVAAAGQLRTVGGLAGGAIAVAVALFGSRLELRRTLIAAHVMLMVGTLASAAAPNLAVLALGQAAVGAAAGLLIAGALAASAAWSEPGRQTRALAIASLGQPMSWVAGMPLGGLLAELDWRYSRLGVPLAASLAGMAALARLPRPVRSTAAGRPLRSVPAWARRPSLCWQAAKSGRPSERLLALQIRSP